MEVRQLAQMNGHASFNEVFMTDAVVSRDDSVGNRRRLEMRDDYLGE